MPDLIVILGQYGLPGLIIGALGIYIVRVEKTNASKIKELEDGHAKERADLQSQIRAVHEQHKADLKEGNKNAIALLADVHEVVEQLGSYADSVIVSPEPRGHGAGPKRPR